MRRVAAPLTLLVMLAGCAAEKAASTPTTPASSQAQQTQSPAPTATPTPTPVQLKATHTITTSAGNGSVTAYAYRQPLPTEFPPDRAGYVYAGLDAKLCRPSTGPVSWHPWSISFDNDTTIEPVSSWSDDWFTVPLYPGFEKVVQAGRCVRGWILFEVPEGRRPVTASYAGADQVAEWQIRG